MVLTDAPLRSDMESLVIPMVACTWLMEESKSAVVFTAAVPRALTAAVTGRNFCPTPVMVLPTACSFCPAASILQSASLELMASC